MSGLDFERSLAVVIGIDQYGNGIAPLRTAVSDATAVANALRENHGYDVITLLDEGAQLSNLQTLITETLPEQVTADTRLIVYFAGHGIAQDGDDGPAGYLIPKDAEPGNAESYLPMVELHDSLTALPCRHFLAIFDCCFAGAFRWSSTRDIAFVPDVIHRERFDRFRQDPAWQVITSASHDQKAMDVLSLRDDRGELEDAHSPFAASLLEALRGDADASPPAIDGKPAGDGVMTATELYLYLRDRVEVITQGQRKRQTPEICSLRNHDKGEYIFLTPDHELNLPPAPELNTENNPYRGLESFDQSCSDLFFGREQEIGTLLQKIAGPHPLTVVLGASGTGKSSLVKAGLFPRLKDRPEYHVLPVMRPGNEPLLALARVCHPLSEAVSVTSLASQFAEDEFALSQLIERWYHRQSMAHPDTKLLLVIDQIEELITLSGHDSSAPKSSGHDSSGASDDVSSLFQKLLKNAITKQWQHLHVMATLRLDFEAQFQDNALLGEDWMDARYVVPPMGQSQLREAIELPAASRVLCFKPSSLVDKLVEDVSQTPGALPLLSFTLSELYLRYLERRSDDRALTEADYRDLGGVAGALTQRATQEYELLVAQDAAYEKTVKHVMLRMVAVEGGELARRRVPLSELVYEHPAENARVKVLLARLIAARLVVQGQEGEGEPYAEPAHDALVRGWDKLLRWKNEEQVTLSLQRQLTPQAINWLSALQGGRGKQAKGFLWDNNPRLALLSEVLASSVNWLNSVEEKFIRRSLKRKQRRRAKLLVSMTGVILGLGSLSAVALVQRQAAKAEAHRANVQNIRSEATAANAFLLAHQSLKGAIAALSAWQHAQDQGLSAEVSKPAHVALVQVSYDSKTANLSNNHSRQDSLLSAGFREKNILEGHSHRVMSVAFSPDGTTLASASNDQTINLWDATTGELLNTLRGHRDWVKSVVFSPDGKTLASASDDNTIRVWDAATGELIMTLEGHGESVRSVAFSPDGSALASASVDQTIVLWEVATGDGLKTFEGHSAEVDYVVFSPDGNFLASASEDETVRLWEVETGELLKTLEDHADEVTSVAFSPDGKYLASASEDAVQLWDAETGEPNMTLEGHSDWVRAVVFSPDSRLLVSAGDDETLRVWDVETGDLNNTLEGHSDWVRGVAFSPDGRTLTSVSDDQTVRLWHAGIGDLIRPLEGHAETVRSVAFSPDGSLLASASKDETIMLWEAATGKLIASLEGHDDEVTSVAFSPDGSLLASASKDETIMLWEAATGQWQQTLEDASDFIHSVAFSPDGEYLASAGSDDTVKLWAVETGEWQQTLEGHDETVTSVAFSPDGRLLASVSFDKTLRLWDAETGELLEILKGHRGDIESVAFSPDGRLLASASDDQTIKLWALNAEEQSTGELLHTLKGHRHWVMSVAFSPDGRTLASASKDDTVKLWDTDTGEVLNTLEGHEGDVSSVTFSPDGNSLASAGEDAAVKLWMLDTERLVAWNCEWLRGYFTHNANGQEVMNGGVCKDYL